MPHTESPLTLEIAWLCHTLHQPLANTYGTREGGTADGDALLNPQVPTPTPFTE